MTDSKISSVGAKSNSLEGRVFSPQSLAEIVEAVDLAFDYRGDVTIVLKSGDAVEGYLFNREVQGADSWLEVFPSGLSEIRRLFYAEVASIAFSGEDTATGKSWEAWVAKKEWERKAEANQRTVQAQARGHL
jgi:hypothetical protein